MKYFLLIIALCTGFLFIPPANAQKAATTGATKADSLRYKAFVDSAYNALGNKKPAQTEYFFKKAIETLPKNSANGLIYDNLGRIQRDLGRNEDALTSFTQALDLFPTAIRFLKDRASLLLAMNRNEQAVDDYTKVLSINPKDVQALLYRAYIYANSRRYDAARRDYTKLLTIEPSNYEGMLGLAVLNQREGRINEAIQQISTMISIVPEKAELYAMRAQMEEDKGQIEAALLDMTEAIARDNKNKEYYIHRATLYIKNKERVKARKDLDAAVKAGTPRAELRELYKKCQ